MYKKTIFAVMKKLCWLVFITPLFFFQISCNKKQLQVKPANLIPYEQVVDITAYSYIIESEVLLTANYSDSARLAYSIQLYDCLFEKHQVIQEDYSASVEFYLKDEDQANKFNEDVGIRLEELRVEYIGE
ncbi:DUF4296 domain-containing protein [Bacteroidales bacterium OttesenSCG-928-B11]|nr:DUF4296 domain-containing protein [Bacteroidales bacterium OttesenSCG-928-B11]MDL2325905.1 DUF4296 domain-containing protein [Bacteroidales bacterium OttesenSCG-928-A14]